MFSLTLLILNIVLFLYILVYGLCFIFLPFIKPLKRAGEVDADAEVETHQGVTVVIPCHHEGPSLSRTADSLIEQNYPGLIRAVILIKDTSDSSFEPLMTHFKHVWNAKNKSATIFKSDNREIIVHCSGKAPKKDKLNDYLPKVDTKYLAFLDADHRADKDWLVTSIRKLHKSTFVGVQSRRAPLSLKKLPQLWDSAQNHIGNELVNVSLDRVVGSVFFTGTSCVFYTEKLKGRTFGDCVTEDTYLSYELLRDGDLITYNAESGTHEEVSPDFHSYIARRRRWSCGHNKTFFTLFPSIYKSKASWRAKLATLIHGLFYTVPVAVCLLLNFYSLHLFVQYTARIQVLIALISFVLSFLITLFMFGRHKSVLREVLILVLWVFPQLTLIFPVILYYSEHELFFFLTLFPYLGYLVWSHAFCLLAPVVLLLMGSRRIRLLRLYQLILLFLTYPLFFFLDLWSCLLGFSDFLFGRPTWAKIQRTHAEDALDKSTASTSNWILVRWSAAIVTVIFLIISFNDLTADSNCGEPDALLFDPKLFVPASDIQWTVLKTMGLDEKDDKVYVNFNSKFSKKISSDVEVVHVVDKQKLDFTKGSGADTYNFLFHTSPGWKSHTYEAVLRSRGTLCKRKIPFTSTIKEFKGNKLFVNGEEFLVKGIIPSFSPAQQKTLSVEEGLKQIKETGANAVRYYHDLRKNVKKAVSDQQLLTIDQPDRSTWNDANPSLMASRILLKQRFEELTAENRGFVFNLFHTLGNELEILNPQRHVPSLINLMNEMIEKSPQDWFAYSTFYVFLRLPMAIYGINMLDSGDTYWKDGIETLKSLGKPFYASEFGGFVAYLEWTPPELRIVRIFNYWKTIMDAGAFGAIFHQSHDNWAQPVVEGYNDPLTPDQPDDLRGIWDRSNQGKLVKRFIEQLFSDFEYTIVNEVLEEKDTAARLRLRNKRAYSLKQVSFFEQEKVIAEKLDFAAGEEKEILLPLGNSQTVERAITARYSTHHGLAAVSQIALRLPLRKSLPVVLNDDVIDLVNSENGIAGKLLRTEELMVVFPNTWKEALYNTQRIQVEQGRQHFVSRPSMEEVIELEGSADGTSWRAITVAEVGKGPQRIRFKLKRNYPKGAQLLLTGLGTDNYWVKYGEKAEWTKSKSHIYRENLLKLDEYPEDPSSDYFYMLIPREKTTFISKNDHPFGKQVDIKFEMPRVFSPASFVFEKLS